MLCARSRASWIVVIATCTLACTPASPPRDASSASGDAPRGDTSAADGRGDAAGLDPCRVSYPGRPLPPAQTPPWRGGFVRNEALERRITAPIANPATGNPRNMTSVMVVDLDGDGRPEVFYNHPRDVYDASVFTGQSVWLPLAGDGPRLLPAGVSGCLVAADLDADGRTDLVCTAPHNLVLWNGIDGFSYSRSTPLASDGAVMSAAAWDLDEDGWLDLVLSTWMTPKIVLRNRGARSFENVTSRWGLLYTGMTWLASFLDLDRDGRPDVYFANDGDNHENYALRAEGPDAGGEPHFTRFRPTAPTCDYDNLFATSNASPMGLCAGDVDLDGHDEIVYATGPDIPVLAWRDSTHGPWFDVHEQMDVIREATTTGATLVPWSPALWDVDHDGRFELIIPTGDDAGFAATPGRGESVVLFYRGLADGRFEQVNDRVGLGASGHYSSVVTADLDEDGDLDLLFGGFGQPVRVYDNRVEPAGSHLLLDLRGTVSNTAGLGAIVTTRAGALERRYYYGDRAQPQTQPSRTLDIPLGTSNTLDELRVTWPSGHEQVLRGLMGGYSNVVTEPEWLTVRPATRQLHAGTGETATVTVRPLDASGELRANARVEIDALDASAAWVAPTTRAADGTFSRVLRAGMTEGSAVVRVTIDGQPARVRPRIWWN